MSITISYIHLIAWKGTPKEVTHGLLSFSLENSCFLIIWMMLDLRFHLLPSINYSCDFLAGPPFFLSLYYIIYSLFHFTFWMGWVVVPSSHLTWFLHLYFVFQAN